MKKRHPYKSNVLLVNITRLGDMLQATPTIAGMKEENPDCKVTVLVEQQFESICHSLPNIDEVLSIDLGLVVRALSREGEGIIDAYSYLTELIADLRSRSFDYCLNMSSSAYTALLLNLVGIKRNGGWTADKEGFRRIESDWARLFATSVFHQNRQYNSLNLVDVFRCSADVDHHPHRLMMNVEADAREYAETLIREQGFRSSGPLIAIQSGASQQKRQWVPDKFATLINHLCRDLNARILLIGSPKEVALASTIHTLSGERDVAVLAGKTTIPQLGAVLSLSDILITGDTGPMHMSVAVGTPVIAMFLASAYGFETGPYASGSIVVQPVIGCGPCNPNKACSQTDCHDTIAPELIARLTTLRLESDVTTLPDALVDPTKAIIYRTTFDKDGFFSMNPMSERYYDRFSKYRNAYRKLWLDDLGGLPFLPSDAHAPTKQLLRVEDQVEEGLQDVLRQAEKGGALISKLLQVIRDNSAPPRLLTELGEELTEVDRAIETIGFHHEPLGALTRMFVFGKENLAGEDAVALAVEMGEVYQGLARRSHKFARYLALA